MNFFVFRCVQCQHTLAIRHHGLCCRCLREINRFTYCGRCGAKVSHFTTSCGNCLREEPAWDHMVIAGRYSSPLSTLIHRFKFQQQFWLDKTLARLLLLEIYEARRHYGLRLPDALLPVPLYHIRQWQRGYNQADLIARQLAKYLNLPLINRAVKRIKHTQTQRGLSAKHRRENLKNAFQIQPHLLPSPCYSVTLIDDVITTGSTLNEIAKGLRAAGVQHIQVWGLAKT